MFYSQFILAKKGPLGTIWIAAHLERKLRKNQVADTDIGDSVDSILSPDVPIALRLSSHLLLGVVRIYSRKVTYLFDDCSEALLKVKQAFRSTAVDLPPEESTAPYHSITLPETFELDDFELPDGDIFQGNYVDHHISTREQITLQDTMDGVVYSTSQFGLDERFGDGDTSQVALDLEEDLLLDKAAASVLEKVSEGEEMVLQERDARGNMMIGPSDAMQVAVDDPRDKIEGINDHSDFVDYAEAEAPSTPGLLEEPNMSSVQKGLTIDNHLESEDHNLTEPVQNGSHDAGNCKDNLPDLPDGPALIITEAQLLQEREDVETLNGHVENERIASTSIGKLRACDSHGTEIFMPPPDKQSEDIFLHSSNASEKEAIPVSGMAVNVEGDCNITAGIQSEDQIYISNQDMEIKEDSGKLEKQPDNVISNDDQCEDLNSSVTYDLPAPETLLSVPHSLCDEPEGLLVESLSGKEALEGGVGSDIGTKTAGRKRNFTESSITVQSVNSVESFGATRSDRRADSIPYDDDLLSSILVGRSSVFKMKSTPSVPEVASMKRARSATRPSALKRKVLVDDSMVLLGDTIRQQLINTEDLRRLRKKAPCTRPEILLIHRQFLEEEIFSKPVLTGMSAELTWLHGQTFDLSGIFLCEHTDNNASGVAKDAHAEFSTRPSDTLDNVSGVNDNVICRNNIDGKPAELPFLADNQQEEDEHQLGFVSLNNLERRDTAVADVAESGASEIKDLETRVESEISRNNTTESVGAQLRMEDEILLENDKEMDASISIRSDMVDGSLDTEVVTLVPGTEGCGNITSASIDQAPENNENDKVGIGYEEVLQLDSTDLCNEESKMDPIYSGINGDFKETAIDMEITTLDQFMMQEDQPVAALGNDTEFLNVDDDVGEEDDDNGIPSTEDSRLLDNSGWSSRTRAVAKYLQTVFDEAAGHGRKILPVDILLNGKTRKEASRMFFETLVLKTRDYIHVEQANPFDSICIKPRAKLMKSDF